MGKYDNSDRIARIDELLEQTTDLDLVLKRLRMTPEEREADRREREEARRAEEEEEVRPLMEAVCRAMGVDAHHTPTLEEKLDAAFNSHGPLCL